MDNKSLLKTAKCKILYTNTSKKAFVSMCITRQRLFCYINLKLILIDGTEKLSEENRNKLYEICKKHGLQIIASRTTDDNELKIIELED